MGLSAKAKNSVILSAIAVVCGLGAPLLAELLPFVRAAENWSADIRQVLLAPNRPVNDDVVVVAVTEETLATLPYRSPIDRAFLAQLLAHLDAARPRAIGLDVLFDQPTEAQKDARLRATLLSMSTPVVLAVGGHAEGLTDDQVAYLEHFVAGFEIGLANLVTDRADGTVRHIFANHSKDTDRRSGFDIAVARAAGAEVPETSVPLAYRRRNVLDKPAFPIFPARAIAHLPASWFEDKVVLIGADLPLTDRHRTPFAAVLGSRAGSLPGILIHAHGLTQILQRWTLPRLGPAGGLMLAIALAAAGVGLAMTDWAVPVKIGSFVFAALIFWTGAFSLFRFGGSLIPVVAPSLALAAAGGIGTAHFGRRARQQKKFIREAFSRYVSPAIVSQLVDDPSQLALSGERRDVTYLFTDLASFTALVERTEPRIVVALINEYLDGMCRIAFEHGATLDKIVGDAVVAFFNAPVEQPDHRERAIACALRMDAFAEAFRSSPLARDAGLGETRIGINSGPAVVGNFGGEMFFDYTGHGDTVNAAARLESINKQLGTRICVGAATASGVRSVEFRSVGCLVVKGKSEGIDAFEPLTDQRAVTAAIAAYRAAFDALQRGAPDAPAAFARVLELDSDDDLAAFHLKRLENGETGVTVVLAEK
jgi:class 3 adenylate cyclase/CHASE2 domain-containing sensor protein